MKSKRRPWFESYEQCGCTFMSWKRIELKGYCERHGTDRKGKPTQFPAGDWTDEQMGYAGNG